MRFSASGCAATAIVLWSLGLQARADIPSRQALFEQIKARADGITSYRLTAQVIYLDSVSSDPSQTIDRLVSSGRWPNAGADSLVRELSTATGQPPMGRRIFTTVGKSDRFRVEQTLSG